METRTKEVFYDIYCKKCKYYELEPYKSPCNECLAEPYNMDSHKPVNFKEDKQLGMTRKRRMRNTQSEPMKAKSQWIICTIL